MPLSERLALLLVLPGFAMGKDGPGGSCDGSVEVAGFQGRIGLVDDLQLLLEDLVAAMGVRVVLFNQRFIARLQTHRGERRFEIEDRQRLLACRGGTRRGLATMSIGVTAVMAICAVPVPPVSVAFVDAEMIADCGTGTVALAEPPARALPHRVAPDLGLDLGVAHPAVVVPREVVGAHMLKAEPVVTVEFEPRPGGAEIAAGIAAGVVAQAGRRQGLGREHGIYRLTPHHASVWVARRRVTRIRGDVSVTHQLSGFRSA